MGFGLSRKIAHRARRHTRRRFKTELAESFLHKRSGDIFYFFQSCKVSQFFLIHFCSDVLLQYLYFSKALNFIYFADSCLKLKKYLLKQYVLSCVFTFRFSSSNEIFALPGVRPVSSSFGLSPGVRSVSCSFGPSPEATKELFFLQWRCQGRLGWLDLAWQRLRRLQLADFVRLTIFEDTYRTFLTVQPFGVGSTRFYGLYHKKFDKRICSGFGRKGTWNLPLVGDEDIQRRVATLSSLPHGFSFF